MVYRNAFLGRRTGGISAGSVFVKEFLWIVARNSRTRASLRLEKPDAEAKMRSLRSVASPAKKRHLDHAVLSMDGKASSTCTSKFVLSPMTDFALSSVFAI